MHGSNAVVTKLRPRSSCSFLAPSFLLPPPLGQRKSVGRNGSIQSFSSDTSSCRPVLQGEQLRTVFADALVRAGSCCQELRTRTTRPVSHGSRYQSTNALQEKVPQQEKGLGVQRKRRITKYTNDELLSLLDYYEDYDGDHNTDPSSTGREENIDNDEGDQSGIRWADGGDPKSFRNEEDRSNDITLATKLAKFHTLLYHDSSTPEDVFQEYKDLPQPGVKYLDKKQRLYLVKRLSVNEDKTSARTLAFLSVLDDYRQAGIRIPHHAWNSAISLGSTTLRKITDVEVEFALKTWKEMELEAGTRGSEVTFNILFDVASKAGKFSLADMVLREMDARNMEYTRFTRVGLIMYHGLRGDGDGVRQAYRDCVAAREIVDTTVLNCVISALMIAGEPDAAHSTFNRMKALSREREGTAYVPKLWVKQRELGQLLQFMAKQARERQRQQQQQQQQRRGNSDGSSGGRDDGDDDALRSMQDVVSIAPDRRTCGILLRHYCGAGEMRRATAVLEEMHALAMPHDARTFRDLFMAFAHHGAPRYSAWSPMRLAALWRECHARLRAADLVLDDSCVLLVVWALVAARRCLGPQHARSLYRDLGRHWRGDRPFEELFRKPEVDDAAGDAGGGSGSSAGDDFRGARNTRIVTADGYGDHRRDVSDDCIEIIMNDEDVDGFRDTLDHAPS